MYSGRKNQAGVALPRPSSRPHQDCTSHVVTSPRTLASSLFDSPKGHVICSAQSVLRSMSRAVYQQSDCCCSCTAWTIVSIMSRLPGTEPNISQILPSDPRTCNQIPRSQTCWSKGSRLHSAPRAEDFNHDRAGDCRFGAESQGAEPFCQWIWGISCLGHGTGEGI
jgi:hypothetical protein